MCAPRIHCSTVSFSSFWSLLELLWFSLLRSLHLFWISAECSDECRTSHGFCEEPNVCRCRLGWRGAHCSQCQTFPDCLHGYCTEAWQCLCHEGWSGSLCNIGKCTFCLLVDWVIRWSGSLCNIGKCTFCLLVDWVIRWSGSLCNIGKCTFCLLVDWVVSWSGSLCNIGKCTLQWQVCHAKKRRGKKKGKADLTTVLHIRELPHLHMKLAVWFSFPTTNNKNPVIPS